MIRRSQSLLSVEAEVNDGTYDKCETCEKCKESSSEKADNETCETWGLCETHDLIVRFREGHQKLHFTETAIVQTFSAI